MRKNKFRKRNMNFWAAIKRKTKTGKIFGKKQRDGSQGNRKI